MLNRFKTPVPILALSAVLAKTPPVCLDPA
jgi:hypothetical protein